MNYVDDLRTAQALWDHLPLGVFVADDLGVVRIVNERALKMTGWDTPEQVIGRSALEFVVPDDLAFVVGGLARTDDFPDVVLGPFRIRYIAKDGSTHWSECWAHRAPDGLGFDGHVVTIASESVSERLATAMRGIATGAEIDASLHDVAAALGAYPVSAAACVLSVDDDRATCAAGSWPLALPPDHGRGDTPWERCANGGPDVDAMTDDLPAAWRDEARQVGLEAVWTRAIDVDGTRRGVLVMWRRMRVDATPNQQRHIQDALDVAALAFSQHDHRSRLARAAHTDHLTGVGNRAHLDQMVAAGIDPAGVLYVDLDGFKSVNDRLGHGAGDDVLRHVADRLAGVAAPTDQLYRVGGDEFVVLCGVAPHRVDADAVAALAGRVVDTIGRPFVIDGEIVEISATVGVAFARHDLDVHGMLEQADLALLGAKRAGKRRWGDDVAAPCGAIAGGRAPWRVPAPGEGQTPSGTDRRSTRTRRPAPGEGLTPSGVVDRRPERV
jgi:diguanylate cyclase (GGDEF)-like protein/PAS domain S-box-containing protein